MEKTMRELNEFINAKIAEGVAKSVVITKLLVVQPVEMWIKNYTLITGSEAKSYYGFQLHPSLNKNGFRNSDRVMKWENSAATQNAKDVFTFLSEHYSEHIMGWRGICSSTPIIYDPEAEFSKAEYRFSYDGRFYEIFPYNDHVEANGNYVAIRTLIHCAKEWKREKDLFFLNQVNFIYENAAIHS